SLQVFLVSFCGFVLFTRRFGHLIHIVDEEITPDQDVDVTTLPTELDARYFPVIYWVNLLLPVFLLSILSILFFSRCVFILFVLSHRFYDLNCCTLLFSVFSDFANSCFLCHLFLLANAVATNSWIHWAGCVPQRLRLAKCGRR